MSWFFSVCNWSLVSAERRAGPVSSLEELG